MVAATLTQRQALDQARRTYDDVYHAVLGGLDDDEHRHVERIYARGLAALAEHRPSDARLSRDAAEAFGAYLDAARDGDGEAKLTWLKTMPRVVAEVTAGLEPWTVARSLRRTYVSLIDTLPGLDAISLLNAVYDVQVSYAVSTTTIQIHDWQFVSQPVHGLVSYWASYWPLVRSNARPKNKQSALALAA